jgi:hypothetical protein
MARGIFGLDDKIKRLLQCNRSFMPSGALPPVADDSYVR